MIGLVLRCWRLVALAGVLMFAWSHLPGPLRSRAPAALARLNAALPWQHDAAPSSATLVAVVDGDTLRVRLADGATTRVRLLMADAPEHTATRASTGHHVDCGGSAALNHMASLVKAGDQLRLTADPTQDGSDRYGRRLAYVSRGGRDLGRLMIRAGWAKVYIYDHPGLRVVTYQAAALSARTNRRGVYAACDGDFHRPAR
ncbi:MAG TPA: thermonuclease family protein [Baekduia sp.]|uniref:thermonuclease family protein n=1 Tax=Baekduia sp. TaxID=2600305 RepID=UPI002C241783|nr:thermonuclease family protein [Baekduia sp.]HMJ34801.1 thermonuclease family protein [Baekduia sp.]